MVKGNSKIRKIAAVLLILAVGFCHSACRKKAALPVGGPADRSALAEDIAGKQPPVVAADGDYVQYADKVVYDRKNRLEWLSGPDRDTDFKAARQWAEQLKQRGGNWRMPTPQELRTLFRQGSGLNNMTKLLPTSGMWVWSGMANESASAWAFNFEYGYGHWDFRSNSDFFRAFAVRAPADRQNRSSKSFLELLEQ